MKKLIFLCSVTFMFLLVGMSAQAQSLHHKESYQIIQDYLTELQPTTTIATLSKLTVDGPAVATNTVVPAKVEDGERFLFTELLKSILVEPTAAKAIDSVVAEFGQSGKNLPMTKFRIKAEQLLSI